MVERMKPQSIIVASVAVMAALSLSGLLELNGQPGDYIFVLETTTTTPTRVINYLPPPLAEIKWYKLETYGFLGANITVDIGLKVLPGHHLKLQIVRYDPNGTAHIEYEHEISYDMPRPFFKAPMTPGVYTYVARVLYRENETSSWKVAAERVEELKIGEGIAFITRTTTVTTTRTETYSVTETVTVTATKTETRTVGAFSGFSTGLLVGSIVGIGLTSALLILRLRARSSVI